MERKPRSSGRDKNSKLNDSIEKKLNKLGLKIPSKLELPTTNKKPPTWIQVDRNIAYISGHGPQNADGTIAGPFGKVGEELDVAEISVDQAYNSAKLAGLSMLGSLKRQLGSLDKVTAWLQIRVMINTVPGFSNTTAVADGFSDLILSIYGRPKGIHARSAIGVQALPLNFPVIVEGIVRIRNW